MANRFAKVIPGSTYIPHPYEEMFKVGLLKDQGIQNIIDKGQDFIDRSNYNTVFNPDTEYKISKVNSLVQSMNEAAKTNLDDPVNANKLRSVTNQFTNDHKVYDAIQRTNVFEQFQKNVKELGEDYRDQNALEYLDAIKRFNAGDQSAGEILKTAPNIDPYKDWEGEFINGLEKLKADKTITGFGSNYLTTTEGVTPERINQLLLNGLSSESYQQMQKDYQYEKYTGMTDKDWEGWVTDKAIIKGQVYSYTQQDAKYSGDANAQARLRLAQATLQSDNTGIPAPVGSFTSQQDLKRALKNKFTKQISNQSTLIDTPYGVMPINTSSSSFDEVGYSTYLAENGGKAIYNLTKSLKLQGLSDADVADRVAKALPHGVSIQNKNGKFTLIGDTKEIENYMMNALTNENTNALGGYTVPNLDADETAKRLFALAGTGGVTISVNGSSPTQSRGAMEELMSELSTAQGTVASISPNNQFGGKPVFEIFVPAKHTVDGTIPAKRYSIGLDDYSQALFSDNTNLYNSKINADWNTPIDLNNKSKFTSNGKTYQYDHGIHTMEVDEDGTTSINTNIVFYDINDTKKEHPYYQDYDSWTQQEVLPQFLNAPWIVDYKKKFNKAGYEGVMSILDTEQ